MTHFICNIKKSLKDPRDYIYIGKEQEIPNTLDYRNELNRIRDQGVQGTCFAQTAACVKEWQERKNNNFMGYFSPQFFYNNRYNKYDIDKTNDEGMFSRDVMKLMKNVGICREDIYPYGKIEDKSEILPEMYDDAKKNIIKSYAQVNSLKKLKESLYENGPCLIAFPVYNYSSEFWLKQGSNDLGGHAVTVVGYTENGFIIRNSWGESWGNYGYSIYNYEDWGAHWEVWTVIDENIKYKVEETEEDTEDDIDETVDNQDIDDEESSEFELEEDNHIPLYQKVLKSICPIL